jgi:hypothetical protein
MQGEQLLQDPDFAQTLAKSPFKAKDLPGLSSAISDTFQKLTPDEKQSLREGADKLEAMPEPQLTAFLRLLAYVEKNKDQYPKLIEQLVKSGAFDQSELPPTYDQRLFAVVKALVAQALLKKRAPSQSRNFAGGGLATLKKSADEVRSAGRNEDTMLAHINPFEATMLKRMGGKGSTNPETGLPEFGLFSGTFGSILKMGATILATAAVGYFTGPAAAGAIVSGVSSLLSGAKPADALKSALIGGVVSGAVAGFTGPGSFSDNALAGGSLFGDKPYETFLSRGLAGTSVGNSMFPDNPQTAGPEPGASSSPTSQTYGKNSFTADNAPRPLARPTGLESTISPKPVVSGFEKMTGLSDTYKWPLIIGGGAALIAASDAEKSKDVVKPSLLASQTTSPSGVSIPSLDPANFQPRPATTTPSVFPGGKYIESPTFPQGGNVPPSQQQQAVRPTLYDYSKIAYPNLRDSGIMNARVGGPIDGPGTGTSDSIPARLSDGEFVMTAKAVRGAGGGDRAKGAKKMYGIMHKFERMA